MNKEKLIQLFAEALDKNVSISIHFSQYQTSGEERYAVGKEEAQALVHQYAEALGTSKVCNNVGQPYADDFTIDSNDFRITCAYVPNQEEKAAGKLKRIAELEKELKKLKREDSVTA